MPFEVGQRPSSEERPTPARGRSRAAVSRALPAPHLWCLTTEQVRNHCLAACAYHSAERRMRGRRPAPTSPARGGLADVLAPSTSPVGGAFLCACEPWDRRGLVGAAHTLPVSTVKPANRTAIAHATNPLQHGERDGEWELRTHDSAGQSFALSGRMATRCAQTSAPEARMGLLPQAPDVAAHLREVNQRWRERRRVLEAATERDDGVQLSASETASA
jgi:hypothetical protein